MPHLLSILVVSFNERRHLDRLKASFDALRLPDGVSVETVLIDGGSRDGTAARARETDWTRVIELPGANIPVCRNAGLRESRGDWVAFIDADCELDPAWLQHAAPLLSGPDPVVLGWPVRPPLPGTWLQRAWHAHWLTKNFSPEDHQGVRVVRREAFRLLTTRNMVMTRSLADAVNGFDENLPTGEDTDFVFRAFQRGLLVLGLPSLDVVHHGEPATLRQFYRQQLWHANRSSYKKILAETGGKSGGNAPRFAALFLAGLGLALAGGIAAAVKSCPCWLLALLPLAALVFLPALRTALRAKKPLLVFPLGVIYFTYGLARALDLAGFYRNKPSWKAK